MDAKHISSFALHETDVHVTRAVREELELLLGVCNLPDDHEIFLAIREKSLAYQQQKADVNLRDAIMRALIEFQFLPNCEMKDENAPCRRAERQEEAKRRWQKRIIQKLPKTPYQKLKERR